MAKQYTTVFKKQGEWYIGYGVEIPGVNTQGRTVEEARENLEDALRKFLLANADLGAHITSPDDSSGSPA